MDTNHPLTSTVLGVATREGLAGEFVPLYVAIGEFDLLADGKTYSAEAKNVRTGEYTVIRVNPEAGECAVAGVAYPINIISVPPSIPAD
ncbi:MAG: hypothetical protein AAB036_06865 [Elusimicrobiota bacterium]